MASRFWRGCRVGFRWCRLGLLLLVLAAACGLLYINQVGVPAVLKEPLLASLQAHGVQLDFQRMRLRMTRGIVVENVLVRPSGNLDGPSIFFGEVQLLLDFNRLLHGHWEVQGLELREGRLEAPVARTGQPASFLELTNIQTAVRFQAGDTVALDHFQAEFKGATLAMSGDVAHASELRNWEVFRAKTNSAPANWQLRIQNLAEFLGKIRLEGAPRLTLNIEGDARDAASFAIRLQVLAPAAHTPWFNAHDLKFNASLAALASYPTNQVLPGIWTNLQPYRLVWSTHFTRMRAENLSAAAVTASGYWRSPELALDVALENASQRAHPPWFGMKTLELHAHLLAPADLPTNTPLPGVWNDFQPYQLEWSTRINGFNSEPLQVAAAEAGGFWRSPQLAVTNLVMHLGGGKLQASVNFDAGRQRLAFTNSALFDVRAVAALLPPLTRERLDLFSWTQPPSVQAVGTVDFAGWHPGELLPVAVTGQAAMTNVTVAMVDLDRVLTHFAYSNQVWQVRNLHVDRQKTQLDLDATEDENTKLFGGRIRGAFDINQIRPWLKNPNAVREVGRLTFHEPLALDVQVRGQLHDASTLAASGHLALTNFAARGGTLDTLTTELFYTNRIIDFIHLDAWRVHGTQHLAADQITLNLNDFRLYFTNGFSTAEPQVVANSIGPKTGRTLEPYEFLSPPTARVNGYISLRSNEGSSEIGDQNLQVEILQGAPFRWGRFNSRSITGSVLWTGPALILTNINAEFYRGNATGVTVFDFRPRNGTDFKFAFDITNANLHWLVADMAANTNQLDGQLSGHLVVTSGNSTNWQVMNGYGQASLRDGLIWDAPMFGILSPALNAINPGLGSSRATDAAGKFTMTNGVIHSDDLEIHSTMMRLQYVGTVDLYENLNARATAQPLRDTWGVGSVISAALWPVSKLFEYKVTGTIADPKMQPLYDISKLLLAPLHPFKTLQNIFPIGNTNSPGSFTNAPPRK